MLKVNRSRDIIFEWILYNQFSVIKEISNTIYLALWNDSQLKYDRNKKEWTRVQVEINLKLFNSQNTVDEFLNKVVEYKNYNFKIYGISQNPDTKDYILILQTGYHCDECALWNDGQLKYDQNRKEWIRVQVEINLKLFNSQNTDDEFLNKVVEYKNNDNVEIYGISQNPYTKDYILVLQTGFHCEKCALWNDGQLEYDQNKKEWTRVQVEINLKLFNSQNIIDEFLNKLKACKNELYGISQNSDTKDYILVFQCGYYCKECGEKYTEIWDKWSLWKTGPLKYDQNKKERTRVQIEVNLKLYNLQNTIDEFLNKVRVYESDKNFEIYGISQNPDTKDYILILEDGHCRCSEMYTDISDAKKISNAVYSALWKDSPLKYNQNKKEWVRIQFKEVILKLCNSQYMIDEFLNKIKVYENDKIFEIYRISQDSDTKDYIMVLQKKYDRRYCEKCIEKIEHKWSLWKDGPLKYNLSEKKWARVQAKEVTLKLCDSQNIINNFLNKIIVYRSDENFEIYGISQNPDTKDYVLVSQDGYCEESLWNDGPLEYESNKKKWVKIYNNYFKIHGITQKPDSKDYVMVLKNNHKGYVGSYCKGGFATVYSAKWKNGPLHYDKEWKRGPYKKVALKLLNKSHDIIDEILKEIKAYSMNKCDMGLCGEIGSVDKSKIYGVMPYVAPEVLRGKSYTKAADIYSFGMIMYFVATGRQPFFDHAHDKVLALGICNGIRPKLNELEAPKCYVELMERCWDSVPDNRPNAIEIENIIYSYNFGLNSEIKKQFKEAEEYRKVNISSISSIEINQSTTHPQASNISRLLNPFTKDLSKCDNNDDHSECLDCSIAD
ncbi:kinase-like domain-containing protein [Rhizophagus irregularis DAOM 181602=DAOM 197198]|nr:kinase-like domain-containing protein [Rhizophagus irregularis DAOM 181602=DAOM 197198]